MGDGSTYLTNDMNVSSGEELSHQFRSAGDFIINVTCSNSANTILNTSSIRVREVIINLRLEPYGAPADKPFQVHFAVDNGTNPTFSLTFNGVNYPYEYDTVAKSGHTIHVFKAMAPGIHYVTIHGHNEVSDVTVTIRFFIEPHRVNDIYLIPLSSADGLETILTTGDTAWFMIDVVKGTSVHVDVDFKDGDGFNETFYTGDLVEWTQPINRSHTFTRGGYYHIEVVLYNSLGREPTISHVVRVFNKVDSSLKLSQNSPIPLNDVALGKFTFTQLPGYLHPTNATVEYSFGDSHAQSYDFLVNRTIIHEYFEPSLYTVVANVSNRVSSHIFKTVISAGQMVRGLGVLVREYLPQGRAAKIGVVIDAGSPANMTLNATGSNLTEESWVHYSK